MRDGLTVHRFGAFELDPANGRLFRDGIRVRVSGPQFAILTCLVVHHDGPVKKDTLATEGWGGAAVADNSVDQAIHRLRKVLGEGSGDVRYIETVPHCGYRLAVPVESASRNVQADSLEAQLDPFVTSVQGRLRLDTLDRAEIQRARDALEDVLRRAPNHARAHALLGMACGLAFEASLHDAHPDTATLARGVVHAQRGCELAPASGEAWSTLAFVLGLSGHNVRAVGAATKALELDPHNWRHALRLAKVAWGQERVEAARLVHVHCPGLALAHWLLATVLMARGTFDHAIGELQPGCAAQDAQQKGSPFPAVGLHLLHGLVCAAQDQLEAAAGELTRELPSAEGNQIYARECGANTWYALGAVRRRQRREAEAAHAFVRALAIAPVHVPAMAALRGEVPQMAAGMERALGESIVLARGNRHGDAARVYLEALTAQPPGAAGWILPVEPTLNPQARPEIWAEALALVRLRAT